MIDIAINDIRKLLYNKKELLVVGLSGFGGSGKSTIAKKIAETLLDCNLVSIDSFASGFDWIQDDDWSNFDRKKLIKEVIIPAVKNQWPIKFSHRPWPSGPTDKEIVLEKKKCLFVEGCSIFHPELVDYFDYKIWIDIDLDTATSRGSKRDKDLDKIWAEMFKPNEEAFFNKYRPDRSADLLLKNE